MHVIAAKAVSFAEVLTDEFKQYQQQIVKNAKTLANALMEKALTLFPVERTTISCWLI